MKTQLTKEQSQHLIDLGIPKEKASAKEIIKFGEFVARDNLGNTITRIPETVPIFRLTDFLSILPNNIGERNRIVESGERGHYAYYCGANGLIGWKPAKEELIDSLYELCVWCIENGYLKFE